MREEADRIASEWPVVHSVGDVQARGGLVLGPRTIEDYELVYFPEGTDTLYEAEGAGAEGIRLAEPGFLITAPGETHVYRFDPERHVRHLFVHFDYGALRSDDRFAALLSRTWVPAPHGGLAAGLVRQILRIANYPAAAWKRHIAILLTAALEELQAEANRLPHVRSRRLPVQVLRAIEYMDAHLTDPLPIEDLARLSGWSHEHFTRVFTAAVGKSPKRALLDRRLLQAESLILRGADSVKEIAYAVGFRDEHHFSKMYKRLRGLTVTAYMERCRDPLFRHTAAAIDPETPYSINCHIIVDD